MSGYAPVATTDADDHVESAYAEYDENTIPNSPPPSFHTVSSHHHGPLASDADRELNDTFDSPDSDDEDDGNNEGDRLMNGGSGNKTATTPTGGNNSHTSSTTEEPRPIERRVTQLPVFAPNTSTPFQVYGGGGGNDGVFANLSAKPTRGEELDEKPPTYEQAAADQTPPYWETTILAPGMVSDEVYVDGLPVGSIFSFIWNAMISMSFQIVGFLLTYLLHTTHAAKNGSCAGLGITLIQFGFSMKGSSGSKGGGSPTDPASGDFSGAPTDPNAHDFDPTTAGGGSGVDGAAVAAAAAEGITTSDWFAYILMIVGWFILIRSVSDFLRARRHEALVLQSPDRGLGVPIVAEGERPETSV
ncbi:metal homeostatis protein bsd2 [Tothia fuscella]|uniref:Metal homeostatis protein bsd2 n=1 Tax=Tothia fuscella TaxID=1048955 RepID=A0A9P4U291_9PEZI|nr:metal homeostatis protein bsd2 [Tothia fuscella]